MLLSQFVLEECIDEPKSENEQAGDNPVHDPSTSSAYGPVIVSGRVPPPGGKPRTRGRTTKSALRLPSLWRRCSSSRRCRRQLYRTAGITKEETGRGRVVSRLKKVIEMEDQGGKIRQGNHND